MKKINSILAIILLCLSANAVASGGKKAPPVANNQPLYNYVISLFTLEPAPALTENKK